jgi:hypothetical protein
VKRVTQHLQPDVGKNGERILRMTYLEWREWRFELTLPASAEKVAEGERSLRAVGVTGSIHSRLCPMEFGRGAKLRLWGWAPA